MLQYIGKLFSPSKTATKEMANQTVNNDKSVMMSADMFVRADGHPMVFVMSPNGASRQQVSDDNFNIICSSCSYDYFVPGQRHN